MTESINFAMNCVQLILNDVTPFIPFKKNKNLMDLGELEK